MLKEIFFGTPVDRLVVKSHGPPVVRGTVFRNGLKISIAILSMGSSLHCDVILPFVTYLLFMRQYILPVKTVTSFMNDP